MSMAGERNGFVSCPHFTHSTPGLTPPPFHSPLKARNFDSCVLALDGSTRVPSLLVAYSTVFCRRLHNKSKVPIAGDRRLKMKPDTQTHILSSALL
jgi:hypothetical protein